MSITVVIARDDAGAPTTREVFESGVKFTTDGGDLSIVSARPQLLANYGSGNWLSVYIDDVVTVISEKAAENDDDSFDFGSFDSDSDSSDTDSDAAEDADPAAPEDEPATV